VKAIVGVMLAPYVSSFIFDCATAILGLTIPIYAYNLGASAFDIGLIGASGGLAYTLTAVVFGRISDRIGRRRPLLASSIILAAVTICYSLIKDYLLLAPLNAVQSLALGIFWPNMEGFVASHATPMGIRRALQCYNISWSLGWIAGPILGGLLIGLYPSEYVFYAVSIFFFAGFVFLGTLSKEPNLPVTRIGDIRTSQHQRIRPGVFILAYGVAFVFALTTRTQGSLFPAYAASLGLDALLIGEIVFFVGLARTITFGLMGILERRLRRPLIFLGPLLLTTSMAIFFTGGEPWHFALACMVLGLGSGISYFSSLSMVLEGADDTLGLRAGLFEGMIGVGSVLGPFLGGLVSMANPRYPYALAGLICVLVLFYQVIVWLRWRT